MKIFGKTDVGTVRKFNQDSFDFKTMPDGSGLAVVCDGMGGANAGNIASELAVKTIVGYVEKSYFIGMDEFGVENMLRAAVESANIEVYSAAEDNPEYAGMGTTAVVAFLREGIAYIVNVGDSRAYLIGEEITQITRDHSVIQALIENGQLTTEEARNHPKKNIITRAVGIHPTVESDFSVVELNKNKILLCSDGLSGMLNNLEVAEIVNNNDVSLVPEKLIEAANLKNSNDNVTAVLIA